MIESNTEAGLRLKHFQLHILSLIKKCTAIIHSPKKQTALRAYLRLSHYAF